MENNIFDIEILSTYFENLKMYLLDFAITYPIIFIIFGIVILFILLLTINSIIFSIVKKVRHSKPDYQKLIFPPKSGIKIITENEIQKFIPGFNKETFLKEALNIFINIQDACMQKNFIVLKRYLTEDSFKEQKNILKTFSKKHRREIIHNREYNDSEIISIEKEENLIKLEVALLIRASKYIINEKSKRVIKGSKWNRVRLEYRIVYQKDLKSQYDPSSMWIISSKKLISEKIVK